MCIYGELQNPVLLDMYIGEVFSVDPPSPDSPYDDGIIAYHNLPLKDYPLVLTEKSAIEIV